MGWLTTSQKEACSRKVHHRVCPGKSKVGIDEVVQYLEKVKGVRGSEMRDVRNTAR